MKNEEWDAVYKEDEFFLIADTSQKLPLSGTSS